MSLSIKAGNLLFKNFFFLYKPLYGLFKKRQDAFEISLLNKYIGKGDTVLDIGANIGFYARIISKLVGKEGKVHCFEPDPANFKHLVRGSADLVNTVLNEKAVGPKSGKIKIYTSPELNVDHRTYEPEVYERAFEIEAVSVDDYVKQANIQKISLIKMDIQGFEMQALEGMKATLVKNSDVTLISEFWPYGLRKAGDSLPAYHSALTQLGFKCYLLKGRELQLLEAQKVNELAGLPKEHYFNILARRQDV
jgi:FkbM family methyltransferase